MAKTYVAPGTMSSVTRDACHHALGTREEITARLEGLGYQMGVGAVAVG
jgi:hypothetical protein